MFFSKDFPGKEFEDGSLWNARVGAAKPEDWRGLRCGEDFGVFGPGSVGPRFVELEEAVDRGFRRESAESVTVY